MSTVTVTGKVGPGVTATSLVLSNVVSFTIETTKEVLTVVQDTGKITNVDITSATTLTLTVSGSNYTLTIT